MSRRMRLLAFDCQAPAHLSAGLWRHEQDQGYRYTDLRYWTDFAKLCEQGRLDEARKYLQRALAIFERSKGPDHPNTVTALAGLGLVAYDAQKLDEALTLNQQALERIQRGMGPDTPRAELPLRNLALIGRRTAFPIRCL